MNRHAAILAALAALLTAVGPHAARAAERGCIAVAIEADAGFRARFPDLLERIEGELLDRPDIDACARVGLRFNEGAVITVSVTLPDGRTASRKLRQRDDVIPTLESLLLLPDPAPAARSASDLPAALPTPASPPVVAHDFRGPGADERFDADRDASPARAAARQIGFELSVITGARMGDGQFGYGAGVLSFLEVKSWLVGFEGRADGYRALVGSDPDTALELAILAGKRLHFGGVALDLTAGPGVAIQGFALSETVTVSANRMAPAMTPPAPRAEPSTGPAPRLLLGARVGFSPRSVFRTFVGIDGEVGPRRGPVGHDTENAPSSRLPAFSVGLALGATVGTP